MPSLERLAELLLTGAVLVVLARIAWQDWRSQTISDRLNLALLALGLAAGLILPQPEFSSRLIGLVAVSGPLLLLVWARPAAFGGGDVKLLAAAGFLLGWPDILLAAAGGILLAGVYATSLLLRKKAGPQDRFACGPALVLAIALVYLQIPALLPAALTLAG